MAPNELAMKRAELISNVYSRAFAAAISTNDPGILPDAEARNAVKGFVSMMKKVDAAYWYGLKEEEL